MPFYTMPDQEQLFVRRFGSGEPVLVLSGLGMLSWQWLPFYFHTPKALNLLFLNGVVLVDHNIVRYRKS